MAFWSDLFADVPPGHEPADRALRAAAPEPVVEPPRRPDTALFELWRPAIRQRVVVAAALVVIWILAIETRLFFLQIVHRGFYAAEALDQQQDRLSVPGIRGGIVDRHGRPLAVSVPGFRIVANPKHIKDDEGTARALCDALGTCTPQERASLVKRFKGESGYVLIRRPRQLDSDQVNRIAALRLEGVTLVPDAVRAYPHMEVAAQTIGFAGADGKGAAGIEAALEEVIAGVDGSEVVLVDKLRRPLTRIVESRPTTGATVELTLDLMMQYTVERELKAAVEEHAAAGGAVVVMEPATGAILASASYPTFNANLGSTADPMFWSNGAITATYEPGSTFKIVMAAASIEEGLFRVTDVMNLNPGYIKLPGRKPIRDDHPAASLTFGDVFVKSSNVGSIRATWALGPDLFRRWVRRFGFGERHLARFPGQATGLVPGSEPLDQSSLASMAIGYQVSVTPLQMAAAVSAIANGGLLMQPHLVRATIRDGVREDVLPHVIRRALRPETAATMTTMMEDVVVRGTARHGGLARYTAAGKTGTSKKYIPGGGYSATDRNSSFVGFVPSRRPAFTILVLIDTPRAGQVYGGAVAAPVFKRIAEALLRDTGVPPTINPDPPVMQRASIEAPALSAPSVRVRPESTTAMPDLTGLGARAAVRLLVALGLTPRVTGEGTVVAQQPAAGTPLAGVGTASLTLRRSSIEPLPAAHPAGGAR